LGKNSVASFSKGVYGYPRPGLDDLTEEMYETITKQQRDEISNYILNDVLEILDTTNSIPRQTNSYPDYENVKPKVIKTSVSDNDYEAARKKLKFGDLIYNTNNNTVHVVSENSNSTIQIRDDNKLVIPLSISSKINDIMAKYYRNIIMETQKINYEEEEPQYKNILVHLNPNDAFLSKHKIEQNS